MNTSIESIDPPLSESVPTSANPIPDQARVAVLQQIGKPMAIQSYPLPRLQDSEVLVRIRCATICGSDLHSCFGRRPTPLPGVLGHEMVGQIADIGPAGAADYEGRSLQIGDRVTWSMVWSCGRCDFCRQGLRPKCLELKKFGHQTLDPANPFFGAMADYCWLPERTAIFRIPSEVPDRVASPANCATATVAAIFRQIGECRGRSVVIQGAGMLGLVATAMAAVGGAGPVIAIDPDPRRSERTLQFGATQAINATSNVEAVQAQLQRLTDGRGADIVIELSGQPAAIELGIELLAIGGHYILAGSTFPSRAVQLSAEQIVRRWLRISGVYNYNPEDLRQALVFLAAHHQRFPFADLVSGSYPLEQVNEAFTHAENERPIRVAIVG